MSPGSSRLRAPAFPPRAVWLGTRRSLGPDDLRGRVVLLDFWTYCCINCLHTLHLLQGLEARHRDDPFLVIGVHSSKFPRERDPAAVQKAMARHGVRHPVVMDPDLCIWRSFGVRAWPSLVLLDAEGRIASIGSGEPDPAALEEEVSDLLALDARRGILRDGPVEDLMAVGEEPAGPLRFPGRVQTLPDGSLAIADSGHNRVLLTEADGTVRAVAGTGERGMADGDFGEATFRNPQGMSAVDGSLYVADTGNHAIRRLDLEARRVVTVAGDGRLGRGVFRVGRRLPGRKVSLRSPWDVEATDRGIAIAMAGSHQIWLYDPSDGSVMPFSGTGREVLLDGRADRAGFNQPSGLSLGASRLDLFVADSEASAVRLVDLETGEVRTLVGRGLFTFGDRDGTGRDARLQHPLAVASGPYGLLVADTFNNKIRHLDPVHEVLTTFLGPPLEGLGEGLEEPGGLTDTTDGRILIADTNNHRIVVASAGTHHAPRELAVKGAIPPPRRER